MQKNSKTIAGWVLVIVGGIMSSIGSTFINGKKKKTSNDSEE